MPEKADCLRVIAENLQCHSRKVNSLKKTNCPKNILGIRKNFYNKPQILKALIS